MVKLWQRLFMISCILGLWSCASNLEEFSDVVTFEGETVEMEPVAVQQANHLHAYVDENQKHQLEWFTCRFQDSKKAASASYFLLLNRDQAGFNPEGFCGGWIAQSFLTQGYQVIGVNRPGYGRSTGDQDLGGPLTQTALLSLFDDLEDGPVVGLWGVNSATIAASFVARQTDEVQILILGNGMYDVEQAHQMTQDPQLKERLDQLVEKEGEMAYEWRSIAWDFSELPRQIYLYHGGQNQQIPASQAQDFRNSLEASEYKVELNVIDKQDQDLINRVHLAIIAQILGKVHQR